MIGIPVRMVSQRELQDKFNANEGGYPQRMNELRKVCSYDELAHPKSRQIRGTRSKVDKFYDGNTLVLVVHYFRKPDGTLGGSGRYDPKKLLVNGVLYWAQ
jgi:hypothetical protein